jgi:pimeloyl-ACP methyl ester carboxylesterase
MIVTTNNEWELSDKSSLVSVGSYSLFVSTRGPPRKTNAPVVIFITGGGAPTECYVHLQYAICKFARNYFFDRAGYGRSEHPCWNDKNTCDGHDCNRGLAVNNENHVEHAWWAPGASPVNRNLSAIDNDESRPPADGSSSKQSRKISAHDSALELHQLMQAINVHPPYVLAAHSYGGIIARTYYGVFPDDIAGIALLDTNSELLQQCLSPIPPLAYRRVTADVDPDKVTHLRETSGMTDEEWKSAVAAVERTHPASANEATHRSGRQLARRMQIDQQVMGNKPLLVTGSNMVGEWRLFFNEGVKLGGGTEEERHEAEWWVESAELFCAQVQRVQLGLSRNAEYVDFEDVGHAFPLSAPERTAEVVKKLLNMVKRQQQKVQIIEQKESATQEIPEKVNRRN